MNNIRRTILWMIFGFSMVMLWDQWQVYNGHKATFFPSPNATAKAPAGPASSVPTSARASDVPASAASAAAPAPSTTPAAAAPAIPRERITASTDVFKITLDSEGATLLRLELLKHHALGATAPDQHVVLLDDSTQRVYQAQTGLISKATGQDLPTHKTPMRLVSTERELKDGANALTLRFESADVGGVKLVKTYIFGRGSYTVKVQHEVVNTGTAVANARLYLQLVRDGGKAEGESSFYSTFTGPAFYTNEKKFQKVEFTDIDKNKATFEPTAKDGYVAMVQHYFASVWLLADGVQRDLFARKVDNNLYAVGFITDVDAVAPGASKTLDATLYLGPQEEKKLEELAPGLELVKDYGWLTILAKPLYWLLDQMHKLTGNWGWAIVALVVVIKAAFYWLAAKGYASMAKMKAINPRIMEMRERLKDKPQEMQQEMMRIYREEKVNPMGGCLPILIPVPVFIALYYVLLSSVEMRGAPWVMWIHDLSAPDPFYILPVLMTATTLLQTWLNPTPPDPVQAKMMWIMPLVFAVMFFFFPSGLVLYYFVNNVLSIAQQWVINKRLGVLGK